MADHHRPLGQGAQARLEVADIVLQAGGAERRRRRQRRRVVVAQGEGLGLPTPFTEERLPLPPDIGSGPHAVDQDRQPGHKAGYKLT
jgi:hypothetical protein